MAFTSTVWPNLIPSAAVVSRGLAPLAASPAAGLVPPNAAPSASVNFAAAARSPNTTTYIDPATTEAARRAFFKISVDDTPTGS
jgi:hypothetical protein